MRILMTADAVGGVWTYALELAGGLAALGHETLLAALGPAPSAAQCAEAARVRGLELRIAGGALEWMDDPWSSLEAAGDRLLRWAEEIGADVAHLNGYSLGALPWGRPVVVAAHSCVLSWWRACKGRPAPPAWAEYRRRVEAGLAAADLVIAPSQAMLASLRGHYAFTAPARVIPNGRDAAAFRPLPKEDFILAAGRFWDEAKNLALLDRAAAGLPWPVYAAGDCAGPDGRERPPLRAASLGRLPPDRLGAWMGRAAVFAHPARYEPFGLAPLEAAHAGCALVLGDIPSLREIWGPDALYADPEDAEAFAGALRALIDDAPGRARWAEAARRRARAHVPAAMAKAYASYYSRLLRVAPRAESRRR
jgi:glycosyltransferase involved in cell wall biosynthesis